MRKVVINSIIHIVRGKTTTMCGLPVIQQTQTVGPVTCPYCQDAQEREERSWTKTLY